MGTATALFLAILNPFLFLMTQSGGLATSPHEASGEKLPLVEESGSVSSAQHALRVADRTFLLADSRYAFYPIRNWNVPPPEIFARTALVTDLRRSAILYQKGNRAPHPIASLTKVMTALVAMEIYDPDMWITLSPGAVATEGNRVNFHAGEAFTVRDLVSAMLVSSSNDAAMALAEESGVEQFVGAMNEKARRLGLAKTHFTNPVGFDDEGQYSSAWDLAGLAEAMFTRGDWWNVSRHPVLTIAGRGGKPIHRLINLNRVIDWQHNLLAGKTGFTEEAQGTLLLIVPKPSAPSAFGNGTADADPLVIVILGSADRFGDARTLLGWIKTAYLWSEDGAP